MAKRTQRRCHACGGYIGSQVIPWVSVTLTGEEVAWHPSCVRAEDAGRQR